MKSRDIPFLESDVGVTLSLEDFQDQFPGVKTLPLIIENGRKIGGYVELVEEVAQNPLFGKMILNEGS